MRKTPLILATLVVVVAGVWLGTGQFFVFPKTPPALLKEGAAGADRAALVQPEMLVSKAEDYVATLTLTGRTEPSASVAVAGEVQGKISAWRVVAGDKVSLGATLAEVDASDRKIKLQAAEAAFTFKDQQYQVAKKLTGKGFSSKTALKDSYSQRESALYDLKMAQLDVAHLNIVAPVAGVVEQRLLDVGSWIIPGTPVAQMLVLNPLKIVAEVSATERAALREGMAVTFDVEGWGAHSGTVHFLGHQGDPKTRTFRIEILSENPDQEIPAGLSVTIHLDKSPERAHKIPGTALHYEKDQVGVLLQETGDVRRFVPVTVVAFDNGQAWVSGLPETTSVVGMGGAFLGSTPEEKLSAAGVEKAEAHADTH